MTDRGWVEAAALRPGQDRVHILSGGGTFSTDARLPVAPLQRLMPWAVLGFFISLATGAVFIAGSPRQYLGPPPSLSACLPVITLDRTGPQT